MKITRAVVPSLFTVLNMFSGFMSIVHSSRGEFMSASWFIVLAAVFDALDGIMARITKSSSQFGVEIDSLSDVVSFGAAPAFLVYQLELFKMEGLGIFLSSLLMIFAGLRLARFNIHLVGFEKDHFVGLPAPASGITVASLVILAWNSTAGLHPAAQAGLPWMVPVLALLMVSNVRYETLPRLSRKALAKEWWRIVVLVIAALSVILTGGGALFPCLLLVIAIGIVRSAVTTAKKMLRPGEDDESDSVEPNHIDT